MKMLEWLELSMEYDEPPIFEAIVTEVRSIGLFMECTDVLQKGVVRREGMPEGHWFYENGLDRFASRRGGVLQAGQRFTCKVMEVDRVNQRVNFEIVTVLNAPKKMTQKSYRPAKKKSARRKK